MIIDMHASIIPDDPEAVRSAAGRIPNVEATVVDETLRRMDACGIDYSVVWRVGYDSATCRRNNDFVSATCDRHPDRLIPFATVWPGDLDAALAELDRVVGELGMTGVKLHPNVMGVPLDDPNFVAVVRRVAELEVPFVTHVNGTRVRDLPIQPPAEVDDDAAGYAPTDNSRPDRLRPLVDAYPSPRFQAAHMGGLQLDWVRAANVTFQTTGVDVQTIQWAVDTLGVERVVFGSDFPFFEVTDELRKVRELDVSDADRARILGDNAMERVFGAKRPGRDHPSGPPGGPRAA